MEEEEEEEEDRISKLPDEILHHILSKIDIKDAVETSILSKRWRNLWTSLPDLDFQSHDLDSDRFNQKRTTPYFMDFVHQFLSHRDDSSTIRKFQLSSSYMTPIESRLMEKFLDYAIHHGVQYLDLDAYFHPTPLKLPDCLLASKTLRVLQLKQYTRSIVVPKPFKLSNLNTLYLECFEFRDDDPHSFPKEPFSSFPNLEKLTLHRCGVSGLIISAPTLKILKISFQDPLFSLEKRIEKISTPRLASFRYEGYASLVCSNVDSPCLEEIYVDISPILDSPYTADIKEKMPLHTVRMLQQLGNAKFVTLTLSTIKVLEMDLHVLEQSPSPFHRIKCLKLTKSPRTTHLATKTVPRTVMNYLTKGSSYDDSLLVRFSEGIEV